MSTASPPEAASAGDEGGKPLPSRGHKRNKSKDKDSHSSHSHARGKSASSKPDRLSRKNQGHSERGGKASVRHKTTEGASWKFSSSGAAHMPTTSEEDLAAVNDALSESGRARLRSKSGVEDALHEFEDNLQHDAEQVVDRLRHVYEALQCDGSGRKPNVLVAGCTGAGKSTLINKMFGTTVAATGAGIPITQHFDRYELPSINIYDSKGLEVGSHEDFIVQSKRFLDERAADDSQAPIDVCWYVVNSAGSRFQPFEGEVCREVFDRLGIIFILNKADISSDEDRQALREGIESLGLGNCIAVLDAVCKDSAAMQFPETCSKCGSDDVDISKKRRRLRCEQCGAEEMVGLPVGLEDVVRRTFDTLPAVAAERFVSAQRVSVHTKNVAARKIIADHHQEALTATAMNGTDAGKKTSLTSLAAVLYRLAMVWEFEHGSGGKDFEDSVARNLGDGEAQPSSPSTPGTERRSGGRGGRGGGGGRHGKGTAAGAGSSRKGSEASSSRRGDKDKDKDKDPRQHTHSKMRNRVFQLIREEGISDDEGSDSGSPGDSANREPGNPAARLAAHTTAVAVLWNRCCRTLYKMLVSEVFAADAPEDARRSHMSYLLHTAFVGLTAQHVGELESAMLRPGGGMEALLNEEFPVQLDKDKTCQIPTVGSNIDLAQLERIYSASSDFSPRSHNSDGDAVPPPPPGTLAAAFAAGAGRGGHGAPLKRSSDEGPADLAAAAAAGAAAAAAAAHDADDASQGGSKHGGRHGGGRGGGSRKGTNGAGEGRYAQKLRQSASVGDLPALEVKPKKHHKHKSSHRSAREDK